MAQQQLSILLGQETACLQQLLSILEQEHDSLLAADIDAIERATSAKNQALDTQAKATLLRQDFTAQNSFDRTNQGLQQFIATCENPDNLLQVFDHLTDLARQCSDINSTNGHLIRQKQMQTRGALNIILQTDASAHTYSDQGNTSDAPTTRSLGEA